MPTVVMLSNFMEQETSLCASYIPAPGETLTIGAFTVTHPEDAERNLGPVRQRLLLVRPTVSHSPDGSPVAATRVQHYQFSAWTVADVPADLDALVSLAELLVAAPGPIVAHCTSGSGRTAMFLALHRFFEYIHDPHAVTANSPPFHLPELIRSMRRARPHMVRPGFAANKILQ